MKVIYVSGKYRADTPEGVDENIAKARAVAINLWKSGWAVICPHMNTAKMNIDSDIILDGDIEILSRCDAVYMLDGWWESEGAVKEFMYAEKHDMDILQAPESIDRMNKLLGVVENNEGIVA